MYLFCGELYTETKVISLALYSILISSESIVFS